MPFSPSLGAVQSTYPQYPNVALPGMPADSYSGTLANVISRTLRPSTQRQTLTALTVTYNAAGTYTVNLAGTTPQGVPFSIATVVTAGADAATSATAIAAALNANATINDVIYATAAAAVVTLTVIAPNLNPITTYTVSATGGSNALSTATITNAVLSAGVPFGRLVGSYSGDADTTCRPITTASGLTQLGVALLDTTKQQPWPPTGADLQYENSDSVSIAPIGSGAVVWVQVAAAVVEQTVPDIVATTGQFTTAGAGTAVTGTRYLTSAAAGGLAKVRL